MISIIIPVYNAANYLHHCVGSLIEHVKCGYEIILVDDGSSDGSGYLCDEYARKHENISVLHQVNWGVSSARNNGIGKAKGEWIWMVDADDYIEEDIDITESDNDKTFIVIGCTWEENGRIDIMEANPTTIPYNTWRCLFRSDLIKKNNIRFAEQRKYAEDQEFILDYLICNSIESTNVGTINENIYHYTVRPGSAFSNKKMKKKMLIDIFLVLLKTLKRAIAHGQIFKQWIWKELLRLTKTLLTTVAR